MKSIRAVEGGPFDLVLRSHRVVLPDGERPAAIGIRGGVIRAVVDHDRRMEAGTSVDLGSDALLPGLVDTHVHVNEPGRTEWEGFGTATAAAAAGGITTLVDMPLNCIPPTLDAESLAVKAAAAAGRCAVDVAFWAGVVPSTISRLRSLHATGVRGFKCFMVDSGVPEFPWLTPPQLAAACAEIARLNSVLLVHAEAAHAVAEAPDSASYRDFLSSRPERAEVEAVDLVARLALRTGARIHVLHVSSAAAVDVVTRARRGGARLTVETCPHYLILDPTEIPDGATQFKCCPPIRETANRQRLWTALVRGDIDCVVSDHSPAPAALKLTGNFGTAWGGIASLQLGLPLVWTAALQRGLGLANVVRWMGERPAALAALAGRGSICAGNDANLVRFAPDREFIVDPATLEHRHAVSPYGGMRCAGVVRSVWLRGVPIMPGSSSGRVLLPGSPAPGAGPHLGPGTT